jgi:carbonic anhydrase
MRLELFRPRRRYAGPVTTDMQHVPSDQIDGHRYTFRDDRDGAPESVIEPLPENPFSRVSQDAAVSAATAAGGEAAEEVAANGAPIGLSPNSADASRAASSGAAEIVTQHGMNSTVARSGRSRAPATQYSYRGRSGPANWGAMRAEWRGCATNLRQSPINFVTHDGSITDANTLAPGQAGALPVLALSYRREARAHLSLRRPGVVGVELTFDPYRQWADLGGQRYYLETARWHTPAEHSVDGVRPPAELQLVHRARGIVKADENLLIVSVMFVHGRENAALAQLIAEAAPGVEKDSDAGRARRGFRTGNGANNTVTFDLTGLIPPATQLGYDAYDGSVSQPPCDAARVIVFRHLRSMSVRQWNEIRAYTGVNARPTQKRNKRTITASRNAKIIAKGRDVDIVDEPASKAAPAAAKPAKAAKAAAAPAK